MNNDTKANAQGKWTGILKGLGFTDKELGGDHGPCPICDGKDRFRYTDYKGGGEYYCSGCGAGGGFDLVMQKFDWEFGYAAKQIDKALGTEIKEVFKPKVDVEKRRRDLNAVWAKAKHDFVMRDYLIGRGLTPDKAWADLRGIKGLFMSGSNRTHDGMLALIRNKDGIPVSIHRTYFDPKTRKVMPPTEKISGAAIRIGEPTSDELVVGEGIETTIAGMMMYNIAAGYACISAHGIETVDVPASVSKVIILADHDYSFTGQKAAFSLAHRLGVKDNKDIIVAMSMTQGDDFNDVIRGVGEQILEFDNEGR